MLNHTPDAQAPQAAAAASTDGRKPFTRPMVRPLPSLRELTQDVEISGFTVQGTGT
ncbi:MAG: hypothetical protein GVY15_14250 [Bacteroidetes bacterium]|nr:hypothetical protein [Bacteroidota bacterium]